MPGQQVGERVVHPREGQDDLATGDVEGPDEDLQGAIRLAIQLRDLRIAEERFHEHEAAGLGAGRGQYGVHAVLCVP